MCQTKTNKKQRVDFIYKTVKFIKF